MLIAQMYWSMAFRCCSNYIFILDITPGFNRLHKDNCMTKRKTFEFWDLVRLILENLTVQFAIVVLPLTTRSALSFASYLVYSMSQYILPTLWVLFYRLLHSCQYFLMHCLIASFMGPTWVPSGADRTQVGPMLPPWTLLSGLVLRTLP